MCQLHAASPGYSDGVTVVNKKIEHERKVYKRECGILKDIFSFKQKKLRTKSHKNQLKYVSFVYSV